MYSNYKDTFNYLMYIIYFGRYGLVKLVPLTSPPNPKPK